MKKHMFFVGTLSSGGAERVISILTDKMVNKGFTVEILTYFDMPVFYNIHPKVKVTCVEVETGSKNIVQNFLWIRKYFKENAIALREEMSVRADYFENNQGEYSVRLCVMEKESAVIDLTLSVPTENQANSLCDNWKKKNQKIYAYLMQELL